MLALVASAKGASLEVDCAVDAGPVTHAANGYLVSVTATQPSSALIAPIAPTCYRANPYYLMASYQRLYQIGVRDFQAALAFNWDFEWANSQVSPLDEWKQYITKMVLMLKAQNINVRYDILNEPDLGREPITSSDQMYVLWREAYKIIRQLDPTAKIVGPSVAFPPTLKPFLLRVHQEGYFPDIVSYHQYNDPTAAVPFATDLRAWMTANGMGSHEISVNEILGDRAFINCGYVAGTLSAYDRAGVVSAHHACWSDPADTTANGRLNCCDNPALDGLLTIDLQKPRAGWWAYKAYADISGRLAKFTSSTDRIDGMAGFDPAKGGATILIGNYGQDGGGSTTLTIRNVSSASYLISNGTVHVKAERIPNDPTGAPLAATIVELDANVPVNAGSIQFVLPNFVLQDSYVIRLGSLAGSGYNKEPTISLASNGTNFTAPASLTLTATAGDSDGSVAKVEFYNDSILVGSDSSAPYTCAVSGLLTGPYALNAKAIDNAGAVSWSDFVMVKVTPATSPPPIISTYKASADFSSVQGQRGWSYLDNLDRPLTFSGNSWKGPAGYLELWSDGGHTGYGPAGDAVRRWTAPASGGVHITGNAADRDGNGGEGVRIYIRKGTKLLWDSQIYNGDTTGHNFDIYTNVVAGDTIDFTIHKWISIGYDTTHFDPTIVLYANGTSGNQAPSASVASNGTTFTAPANIVLTANANDSDGTISKVEFFQGATLLGSDGASPYSFAWNNVPAGSYSVIAKATDNVGAQTASAPVSITVNQPSVPQTPFTGTPMPIPGTILTAQYDIGGEGVAYHDVDAANFASSSYRPGERVDSSGAGVGWIVAGEWLEYSVNVSSSGVYMLSIPVSHPGAGGTMHVSFDGVDVTGTLTIPNTGDWGAYQNIVKTVNLSAGPQVMRVMFNTNGSTGYGPGLLDISITSGSGNAAPTVSLTAPANNATFTAPATIVISANAADSDGSIGRIEFYRGTALIAVDPASPYSFTWNNVPAGSYSLTAKAIDNAGAQSTSAAVNVTVNPAGVTQTPYTGTAVAVPGIILTAQYDKGGEGIAYHDVDSANFASSSYRPGERVDSGGTGVGWIVAGEWLEYSVNVSSPGVYAVSIPVSHPGAGGTMHVSFNGVNATGSLTIPNTGDWGAYQNIVTSVNLDAGPQIMQVMFDTNGSTGYGPGLLDISISSAQSAYGGTPMAIPGSIATACYDNGGEGVAYHDTDSANLASGSYRPGEGVDSNGSGVGWIRAGEWLEFTVSVATSGSYTVSVPVSHPGAGGTMHVSFDGVNVSGSLTIPNTGGWDVYQNITFGANLHAGTQFMLVMFDSNGSTGYGPGLRDIAVTKSGANPVIGNGVGLNGTYFDNADLTAPRFTRVESAINFNWGTGSPDPGGISDPNTTIGPDTFSVRWSGQVQAQLTETYAFITSSDDGVRLWVNGQKLIDNWTVHAPVENSGSIALVAGQKYDVVLEYFENLGGTEIKLFWSSPSTARQVVPQSQLYVPPVGGTALGFLVPPALGEDRFRGLGLSDVFDG